MGQRTERPDADNLMLWLDSLNKKERRRTLFYFIWIIRSERAVGDPPARPSQCLR